jgi:hypothetical protein
VTVVVYGTREVSTRVVVWFEPGILKVLVLVSVLVSVTTVVNGTVAVERIKDVVVYGTREVSTRVVV